MLMNGRLPITNDVDYALDLLVHSRHRSVFNYQYHSPAWRDPRYAPPQPLELARITSLQLYMQHVDDCDLAGTLINSAPLVKNLALEFDCRIWYVNEGYSPISRPKFEYCTCLSVVERAVRTVKPDYRTI